MIEKLYYPLLVLILFVVEELYMLIATQCRIVDIPDRCSSHKHISVRGGGVIFWVAVLLYMLLAPVYKTPVAGYFFAGLTLIATISFIDDIKNIKVLPRLIVQFISVLLLLPAWSDPSGYMLWAVPLILVVAVGIFNAFNFMDGINGMTVAYSFVVLTSLSYINQYLMPEPVIPEALLHSVTFSVLIFGYYNFRNHARCFAGDVGAISIAFIIVYAIGALICATGQFTYLMLLAVYGVDSVLTIVHRLILRHNILESHRMHLYEILTNNLGWKHLSASLLYAGIQAVISTVLFLIPQEWLYGYSIAVLLLLSVGYFLFMRKYFHLYHLDSE